MIRISQVHLPVVHSYSDLKKALCKKLHVDNLEDKDVFCVKKSLDARNKKNIIWNYIIDVRVDNEDEVLKKCDDDKNIAPAKTKKYHLPQRGSEKVTGRICVVGSGPCGLFAAYMLAKFGYNPVLIEQGHKVEERIRTVNDFFEEGKLDTDCNIQFGEGGAGTFSDGKLNTGVNDSKGRNNLVLKTFVENGAPSDILFSNKPHLGTDVLSGIIKNMRDKIVENGGLVMFDTKFVDFEVEDGALSKIILKVKQKAGDEKLIAVKCNNLVLAIGHSARDTYKMLYERHIKMFPKPFAVGIRIEHNQEYINKAQYGLNYKELYGDALPVADYKLTCKTEDGRSVYSFCMCPGGYVVNSSSENGRLCVNGMSFSARDSKNANSAIVVSVNPEDFCFSGSPLDGLEYQRILEYKAYTACNGKIPVQLYKDFKLKKKSESFGSIIPETQGDTAFADLNEVLPDFVSKDILEAFEKFDKNIPGFAMDDAVLSGIESRTSSPVRIQRDDSFETNIKGIYPCGEGAGYAGGITSAAIDGIKVFETIYSKYKG